MTPTDKAAASLVEVFKRLTDPACDPDRDIRSQLREFQHNYLRDRKAAGGSRKEGEARLIEAVNANAAAWAAGIERLRTLWREVWVEPAESLPPLSPPAQLIWIGNTMNCSNEVIETAVLLQFPAIGPDGEAVAWQETAAHYRHIVQAQMETAAFKAWADIQQARGRPEAELTFGACCSDLDIIEERGGERFINLNRLKRVADPVLRHAVIGAAWKAQEAQP